jgi:hypothetical protein
MKNIVLTLVCFLTYIQSYAQLNIINSDVELTNTRIKFVYQGNVYVAAYEEYSNYTLKGFYKINPQTLSATRIGVDDMSLSPYGLYLGFPQFTGRLNPQFYGNNIYMDGYQTRIFKLDIASDTLHEIEPNQFGQDIYLFKDRLYTYEGYKDLITDNFVSTYSNKTDVSTCITLDNSMYCVGYDSMNNILLKQINSAHTVVQSLNGNDNQFTSLSGFYPNIKPIHINGHLLFHRIFDTIQTIASFATNNFSNNNLNLLDITGYGQTIDIDYIILNDGVIFQVIKYNQIDGTYTTKWYKTDGINNAVEINYMPLISNGYSSLNGFFRGHSAWNDWAGGQNGGERGNNFITIGGTTYFSTYHTEQLQGYYEEKVWKMTSVNSTPELIYSVNSQANNGVEFATEWQGNLIFYSQVDSVIYQYDGTTLSAPAQLNSVQRRGTVLRQSLSDFTVTGIVTTGSDIIITTNQGVYTIDNVIAGVKSIANIRPIQIYPNPVNNFIQINPIAKTAVLLDITGRELSSYNNVTQIDLSSYEIGTYIILLEDENKQTTIHKIIKE